MLLDQLCHFVCQHSHQEYLARWLDDHGYKMTVAGAASDSVLLETVLFSVVRLGYFLACRQYVSVSLFSNLRNVIREDQGPVELDSPGDEGIELDGAESGYFGGAVGSLTGHGTGNAKALASALPLPATTRWVSAQGKSDPAGRRLEGSGSRRARIYTKLSTALFCLSFSESCTLFTLLLFGEAVSERARTVNWSFSLLTLLALIVFVIPLGLCLLLTYRTRTTFARTLLLTLVPFSIYLFTFYRFGHLVAHKSVVAGSHSIGFVNTLLSRICVPGVVLIASLSGGGAINTAWEAYEWRSISSAEPVTDAQILQAERALYSARLDLQSRLKSLNLAQGSAQREADSASSQSLLSRLTSSNPAAAHLKSLEVEVAAMESVEQQMVKDVATLKRRKMMREMGRSWRGRLWLLVGWLFSLYCVWRVFVSGVNLIFGYSRRSHQSAKNGDTAQTTDVITSLLTRIAVMLDVELDIATWSRLLGLVLIGGIILANMRNVLASVSRIFKATSTGVSASFMLLFLAQLMAIYLLTSLISLPSSPTPETTTLLDTLPDFNVFSRLFDSVFLLAAATVFVSRFAHRKLRDDEAVTHQYS
ncbi:Golgi pH regulator family protein [Sporobolomyces koalae]|uniref:Golgi pH regulator family protein n=1 Tax=Sporobolomyces koalae TaxID=500713 RepID=UPI003170E4AD